MKQILQID